MIRPTAPLAVALLAGACSSVRPVDVKAPEAPASFIADLEAAESGRAAREEKVERATEAEVWWTAFADPALDGVIQEALRSNYFIRDVRTLIYENMLDPTIPWNWLSPLQVGIPAGTPAGVQHVNVAVAGANPAPLEYTSANIGLTASYQIDLWGNLGAQRRVAREFAEQQRQSTELASHNIAEQVAQLWFDILVERELKKLAEREVEYNQELFNLVKARFDQHLVTRLVVLQQEQQLLATQAQVPLIAARIAILNSQLTGLLGRLPSPHDDLVPAERRLPDLPPAPHLGTPKDLLQNTPEMRFARLRVTEIEHRVNQNLSSWLPTVEVIGSAGVVMFEFDETIRESFAGVRMSWPIFDGGRRIIQGKQLDLTLKRRKWQYELALKTAIGRVQDALLQEKNQAESLQNLRAQVELGRRLLEEARKIFVQGGSDYLPVLTALSNLAALERDALRAQRLLLSYRVQLYRALGGIWSYDVTKIQE